MLGFNWNGTLSRTAVGATLLLLLLSYSEFQFWLELSNNFLISGTKLGEPIIVGLFVFFAYSVGTVLIELPRSKLDWEKLIADALIRGNSGLLEILLDNRSRSDLLRGLSHALWCFVLLGFYNLAIRISLPVENGPISTSSILMYLVPAILFGSFFGWQLKALSKEPFYSAARLLDRMNLPKEDKNTP